MLLVEHCLPSSTLSMGNMASELSETVSSHIVILSKGWLSQRQSMATLRISKGAVHGSHHQKINTSSFVYWRPEKLLHLKYTINMINKAGRQSAKVLLKKKKDLLINPRQRLEIGCQILHVWVHAVTQTKELLIHDKYCNQIFYTVFSLKQVYIFLHLHNEPFSLINCSSKSAW